MRTPLAAAAFAAAALAGPAAAHPSHRTLAEVEYKPGTGKLEVALRVPVDHLEEILRLRTGRPVSIDDESDLIDELVNAYLGKTFVVKDAAGERRKPKWVGKEVDATDAWLYFEVPVPAGIGGAKLTNTVLFDLLDDQENVVNFKAGGRKASLTFKRTEPTRGLEPPE